MPRINLPVLIGFFSILNCYLQAQTHLIEFNQQIPKISNNRVELIKVVDARKNQEYFGKVFEGNRDSTSNIDFKDGLKAALFNFLSPELTLSAFTIPVWIEVYNLSMNEIKINNNKHRVSTINLAVYHDKNGISEKIVEEIVQRGRLVDLSDTKYAEDLQDLLRLTALKINQNKEVKRRTDLINPKVVKPYTFNHRITLTRSIGLDAKSLSIQYYGYQLDTFSDWVFPFALSADFFTILGKHSKHVVFEGSKIAFASPGISAFKNLSTFWWLNLRAQIPIGSEKAVLWHGTNNNFVIGLSVSQSIMMIPVDKVGITFGIGTYQRLLKSQIYPWDIGATFEFGLKF